MARMREFQALMGASQPLVHTRTASPSEGSQPLNRNSGNSNTNQSLAVSSGEPPDDPMASLLTCPNLSRCPSRLLLRAAASHQKPSDPQLGRRDFVLRSSEIATLAAIFHFSGSKPGYLGVQKSPPSLALCPATDNCVSTTEETSDRNHYAPPWNYNPEDGPRKKTISREEAMTELLQVVTATKPENFTPKVVERKGDYIRVEYESPIMGFVDDVEFWFPPGKESLVEYRSASRLGSYDFNTNKKRIKALRLELEKKGWASESSF